MAKSISHFVTRPGRKDGDGEIRIPVAEDLASVPGVPQEPADVDFYSREYPLETQAIDKSADRQWAWSSQAEDLAEFREEQDKRMEPMYEAARVSATVEPTGTPVPGEDLTEDIRRIALELGFGEVGFARYDRRYTFKSKQDWAQYEHAICLALEQDYAKTQTGPSTEADVARFETYEVQMTLGLELADYIRARGYHAQFHDGSDNSGPYIPLFVAAGLGQMGANGQLLSPHFGSRSRLMLITTDAPVTYDQPIDYGIHKFCQQCQVCVNRCPGRARTIAKSGGLTTEAGDGLCWAEGTGLGSQGHGHPEGKPSLQSQGVQRNVDQRGVYLAQPRTAQRVDVLIPTAVLHMVQAVLHPPVVAEHSKQFLGTTPPGTQAAQQIPVLPAHLPGADVNPLLLHHRCLPRPGKSQLIPDILSQRIISPDAPFLDHSRFFSTVSASGSPSSSRANPSAIASSTSGWFPLIRTR